MSPYGDIFCVMFKNCSPFPGRLWYTNITELESVREADAMAIAMDNATAFPVALRYSNIEDTSRTAAHLSRRIFMPPYPELLGPYQDKQKYN